MKTKEEVIEILETQIFMAETSDRFYAATKLQQVLFYIKNS